MISPSIILSVTPRPGVAALAGTRGLDKSFYWGHVGGMLEVLVLPAFESLRDDPSGVVLLHLPHGHDPKDDPSGKGRFALQGPAVCEQRRDMLWAWDRFAGSVHETIPADLRSRLIIYTGSPSTMPSPHTPGAARIYRRSIDQYINADETGIMMDHAGSSESLDQDYWRWQVCSRWQAEDRFVGVEGGDATYQKSPGVNLSLPTDIAWMTESRWLESKTERITEQVGIGRCCIALCQTWDGKLDRDRQAAEIRRARELGMVVCLPHADLDDMAAKGLTLAGMRRVGVGT